MSVNYLQTLAAQQQVKRPLWLLQQVLHALQSQIDRRAEWPEKAHRWWDLLRFCTGQQSVAVWLRDEPAALQRIHALADLSGQHLLADILSEALQGQPQEPASITFSSLGEADLTYALHDPLAAFNGCDWSATDIAIELHSDGFASVVAQLLFADLDGWHLDPPASAHARIAHVGVDQGMGCQIAQALPCAEASLQALMAQGSALALDQGTAEPACIAVTHLAHAVSDPDLHAFYQVLHAVEAADLVATTHLHGGADLFKHGDAVGLRLFAPVDWEAEKQIMLQRAHAHIWPERPEAVPQWLYTAIAFAQAPADTEHWILATDGPWAGCIMLSETDVLNQHPRFSSTRAFFAALHQRPESVLNATGFLRYPHQGQWWPVLQRAPG